MLKRENLLKLSEDFVENTPFNTLGPHTNDAEDVYGLRIFDKPIMAIGRADDPYWKKLWEPQIVGQQFMLPEEWLPGAKTVISFFLPSSEKVKDYCAREKVKVVKEWLCARTDAQWVLMSLMDYVCGLLKTEGFKTCVPSDDPRFTFRGWIKSPSYGGEYPNFKEYGMANQYEDYTHQECYKRAHEIDFPLYNSNWSERHVAYVCGLGTFGLSTNLITKKGSSGRFMSIVTDWEADAYDIRPYTDYMEYCNHCGACIVNCPGHAITKDGKNKKTCHDYFQPLLSSYDLIPRYGCGKCQTAMPCDGGIPPKRDSKGK